jgi:putative nucleotidyltransferase with HDIG domain
MMIQAAVDIQTWLQADPADLPVLAPMAGEVLSLVDEPGAGCTRLAEIIAREPVLAARVLRLVNSAYFGLPRKVSDIRQAVFLLGFRTVRTVVLTASALSVFEDVESTCFDLARFWQHSISAAAVCRALARRCQTFDAETAFTLGLLHDLGKLVLVRYRPDEAEQVVRTAQEQSATFFDSEQQVVPISHPALGAWLARRWQLPPVLVDGLSAHHAPPGDNLPPLHAAIRFANYLCTVKGLIASGSCAADALDRQTWDALRLSAADLPPLLDTIDSELRTASELLQNS